MANKVRWLFLELVSNRLIQKKTINKTTIKISHQLTILLVKSAAKGRKSWIFQENKPVSEEIYIQRVYIYIMCRCVSAAFTLPACVPRAAMGQCTPWDRLGPGDRALIASISHITQERNWDAGWQMWPGTWLDVHPAHCNGARHRPWTPAGSSSSLPTQT